MASKKEYEMMAEAIGKFLIPLGIENMDSETRKVGIECFVMCVMTWYSDDNPNFSWDKFMAAVTASATEIAELVYGDLRNTEGTEGTDDRHDDDGIMTNDL